MLDQKRLNNQLLHAARDGDLRSLLDALNDGANAKDDGSIALCWAANRGHTECVNLLIPLSDPSEDASLALGMAAYNGHLECLKLLLPVSDPLANDSAALRWAAEFGHAKCVALLLPVSDVFAVDEMGLDAAALARESGRVEVGRMIEAFIEAKTLSIECGRGNEFPRAKSAL